MSRDTQSIGDWYEPTRNWCISQCKEYVKPGPRLLELGVNSGAISSQLRASQKVGLDIDKALLAQASKRGIKTIQHDLNYPLPLSNNYFNNVVSVETFEHVSNYYQLLQECHRVLKPGGRLIIIVPYHGVLKNIAAAIADERHFMDRAHVHFYNPRLFKKDAQDVGFKVLKINYFGRVQWLWRVFCIVLEKKG